MKDIKLTGKTKDGAKVEIRKDGTHFHAYSEDGKEMGQPFMNLDYMLTYFSITLDGQQEPAAAAELPQAPVEKKVGEAEAGEKRYELTFDGHHYRAHAMQGPAQKHDPKMDLGILLKEIGATGAALDTNGWQPVGEIKTEAEQPAAETPAGEVPADVPLPRADVCPPADVTACGQHDAGNCKMDNTACEGACGEHASRAAKEKEQEKTANKPEINRKRVK